MGHVKKSDQPDPADLFSAGILALSYGRDLVRAGRAESWTEFNYIRGARQESDTELSILGGLAQSSVEVLFHNLNKF